MHSLRTLSIAALIWAATSVSLSALTVGGKSFTEQLLIAEMTRQLLETKGHDVKLRVGLSSTGLRTELEIGLVDLYWEYTGTALAAFHRVTDKLTARDGYLRVRDIDHSRGVVWLTPSRVNNTYALAMRRSSAQALRIIRSSDLAIWARQGGKFKLGVTTEFYIRPDGLTPLQRSYGFDFMGQQIVRLAPGAVYALLQNGQVDVGLVFATDGRVASGNLQILQDDQGFFPSYLLTPVVRQAALDRDSQIANYLNALTERLEIETMAEMNGQVELQNKSVGEVARAFLLAQGLISP